MIGSTHITTHGMRLGGDRLYVRVPNADSHTGKRDYLGEATTSRLAEVCKSVTTCYQRRH